MFGNTTLELNIEKLDTTPTDFEKIVKSVDVGSLKRVAEYLEKRKKKEKADE